MTVVSIIVLLLCKMQWISLVNVSVRWSVRQTNGVYLHYFSSTYNFLPLLSCGSLGQGCIPVLCWCKQILQPSSLHFHMEPHVAAKPEAGECESGRISECTERQCLDAVRCAHLFDVVASNTIWILVKICRSGRQNVRSGRVSVLQASIIQNFLGWWDYCCSTLYCSYVHMWGRKEISESRALARNRPEHLSCFLFQPSVLTMLHFLWIIALSQITLLIQTQVLSKCSDSVIHHRQIMGRFVRIYLEIASHS